MNKGLTTDPNDPELGKGINNMPVPQNKKYLVLSEEERQKGFIRPLRTSYIHRGRKTPAKGTIQTLEEALEDSSDFAKSSYTKENGYSAFLKYPDSESPLVGRFLKEDEYSAILNNVKYTGGCGTSTKMALPIAETYARQPSFYGATYCMTCQKHLPVNEFTWEGTDELVGS